MLVVLLAGFLILVFLATIREAGRLYWILFALFVLINIFDLIITMIFASWSSSEMQVSELNPFIRGLFKDNVLLGFISALLAKFAISFVCVEPVYILKKLRSLHNEKPRLLDREIVKEMSMRYNAYIRREIWKRVVNRKQSAETFVLDGIFFDYVYSNALIEIASMSVIVTFGNL